MRYEVRIPKMGAVILCRNEREKRAAKILINNMRDIVDAAAEGYSYALDAVREFSQSYLFEEMYGTAAAFFHMGMLEEPISSVEFARACRAMWRDRLEADGCEELHV